MALNEIIPEQATYKCGHICPFSIKIAVVRVQRFKKTAEKTQRYCSKCFPVYMTASTNCIVYTSIILGVESA